MHIREFIFSNKRSDRIKRHFALWIGCYLLLIISYPPNGTGSQYGVYADGTIKFYEMVFTRCFVHLICQMLFCYPLLYFLMPMFFWEKKYLQFICGLLLLWAIVSWFRYVVFIYGYNPFMKYLHLYVNPASLVFLLSISQVVDGPAFIGCIFIGGKFFKDRQQKQQDNFNLKKENANAELSLLKAQIHPHFLFNTLNNIYFFTLNKSLYAKYLVKKLEKILRYMVEECDQPLVLLNKEINIINDYIELEKVRYGNNLNIEMKVTDDKSKSVVPLLMIPFIENSFKHGASKMLTNPWIKLNIEVKESVLYFSLINSKPHSEINSKKGIGLGNVKKRLQLLYPQNHYLQIESTEDKFIVDMHVPLHNIVLQENKITEKLISVSV